MNKKVLFVTYGGGHVNMVIPIVKLLMQKPDLQISVFGLTTARKIVEQMDIPCFSCRDLPLSADVLAYGKALLNEIGGGTHPDIPAEESIAYLGLSYASLVKENGEEGAKLLYKYNGRQSFLPVKVMEDVISMGDYQLVVTTNSPRMERAAIVAAGNLGVPSLCMVDLFAQQGVAWIGERGYADKICVIADSVKQTLLEAGRTDEEVVVTGNPAFDRLADETLKQKAIALRKNKGWEGKKVILWCSQFEPKIHPFTGEKGDTKLPFNIEKELKNICDLRANEGWELFVRPHPSENMDERKIIQGVTYGREDELAVLLSAVNVVVVTSSTVGLEAVLLGKPVVALSMSIFSADMPFAKMDLAEGVDCLDDLECVLKNTLIYGKSTKTGFSKVGNAANRIVKEVISLLD